jgi:hypothetical protein
LQNTLLLGLAINMLTSEFPRRTKVTEKNGENVVEVVKVDPGVKPAFACTCAACRKWVVWIAKTFARHAAVPYQVFLVGMIACCVGAILSSTIFVMEINTKAQPLGFGEAKEWAQIAQSASSNNCNIFSAGSGVYTEQPLQYECIEHNTVDNYIRRLICTRPVGRSMIHAPADFTLAALACFLCTITCYIAAKYQEWLFGLVVAASLAVSISAAVIYPDAVGYMSTPYKVCQL